MKIKKFITDPNAVVLGLIMVLAVLLRFYGLTNQSLWLDELHTMNETDPTIPWSQLFFYLEGIDPHPPLFFVMERIFFQVFGHTEFVARCLPALCGVVSVWAMYLLGTEILNKKLGLVAALITCINFFNIQYSQEARGYIVAMLFSTLSLLYFIKLVKDLRLSWVYLYAFFTVLMLYSHYYSLFVFAAQGLLAFILWLGHKEKKRQFFKMFAISMVIIIISYLPWIPFVIGMSKVHSFWISPIQADFATTYFFDYFGNNQLLQPLLVFLLIYFCGQVFRQNDLSLDRINESPPQLTLFVSFVTIAATFLLPYIRSVLVLPMLYNRYTIVVLPAFLIVIAFAMVMIENRVTFSVVLAFFVAVSLIDTLIVRKYYSVSNVRKTQFREMTQFISEDTKYIYPIVEERTPWQHKYYLKKFGNSATVLSGVKEATVDSILHKTSPKFDLKGFWIVGAHANEPRLRIQEKQRLDSSYEVVKAGEFFDAWAELYLRKSDLMDITKHFADRFNYGNDLVIPLWGGVVTSRPFTVDAGNYSIKVRHRGTPAMKEFPRIIIYANDIKIGDFYTQEQFSESVFSINLDSKKTLALKLDFQNDIQAGGEDRNAFIKTIILE